MTMSGLHKTLLAAPAPRAGLVRAALGLSCCLWLTGCSFSVAVAPWQKGLLAKPEMGFEGEPLERAFQEHIYTSRESAVGGSSVGGGGCGCN